MGLDYKKEFLFGIIIILLLFVVILFVTNKFKNESKSLSSSLKTATNININLTWQEIAKHNNTTDCWLLIESKVYEVTSYLNKHPGGGDLIIPYCGKEATLPFQTKGGKGIHSAEAQRLLGLIYIGDLNGKIQQSPDTNAINLLEVEENEVEDEDD